jgi:hypothetical protein
LISEVDSERTADDRLDSDARHLVGEFERPEHVVGVGERQGGLVVGLRQLRKLRNLQRSFEQ